jgi:glycosyltransferase involved in cell wall biosynthesis
MNILIIEETDWLRRGPHIQQHIFERLSKTESINVTVLDYDIDNVQKSDSLIVKRRVFENVDRTVPNNKVKIIRTGLLKLKYFRRVSSLITNFFELFRIIWKQRPDIIVNYAISNGLLALIISKLYGIPFIFHYIDILHNIVPIPAARAVARSVNRIVLKYSDLVLIYSKFHKQFVMNEGVAESKIRKLPNGISLENTVVDVERLENLKDRFGLTGKEFVLFFMGYLYDFAGLKEIIDYYNERVNSGDLDMRFLIVGDGGIYSSLKKHVAQIGADWVILTGRVPYFEITEYIELADLCLLSFAKNEITKEITPIKLIEYMAMGKPVLSNSLPGVFDEIGKDKGVIFANNQI